MNQALTQASAFAVGDSVNHKQLGIGTVTDTTEEEYYDIVTKFVVIKMNNGVTAKIPATQAATMLIKIDADFPEKAVIRVLLQEPERIMVGQGKWPRVERELREKLHSGDLRNVAALVRDTATRNKDGTYGIRQIFLAASTRLIDSFAAHWKCDAPTALKKLNRKCKKAGVILEYGGSVAIATHKRGRPAKRHTGSVAQAAEETKPASSKKKS